MRISVIIPTLNEAANIADLIAQTRDIGDCEIVVVDGGSTDDTCRQAVNADRVLNSPPGRARQQNLGAASCRGDVLLFLHADCRLPSTALDAIRAALADGRVVGGCFQQHLDSPGLRYRWIERGNVWRVRLFKLAYGDQAIFVRRTVFENLGRFPELRLMEDVFLMKRLRRTGRFVLLPDRLTVSIRRWKKHGVIRQTLRNWLLLSLALCGVSTDRLARFYPNTR
jgi:rSAM/selenodomain-associated transferase 2